MELRGQCVVKVPFVACGLTFSFRVWYTKNAMEPAVTRAELEHVLRTMLQIVDNAYYRASPFTVEHDLLSVLKRMLEAGISTLQRSVDAESVGDYAND